MSTSLTIGGVALDMAPDTVVQPNYQVSDLLDPLATKADYSPEFAVPGTNRNHSILGMAAYESSTARVPYKSISGVTLRSEGAEIMPRARLFVKGYDAGQYQLQLFAGNKRLVVALGEKTLRELDLSRFDHLWTLGNVASRATQAYRDANGWGYELFERGKPLNLLAVSPYELSPTLSARLIWEQILMEAGFGASDWQSPLLDKLLVPSVAAAVLSEDFRRARRLRVTTKDGEQDDGEPSSNRSDVVKTIPFGNSTLPIGTVAPIVPTVAGIYNPATYSYRADQTMYVRVEARTALKIIYSDIRLGRAQAEVELHINGVKVASGDKTVAMDEYAFSAGIVVERLLLKAGDVLSAVLRLSGVGSAPIDKWGYEIFQFTVYRTPTGTVPEDKFQVEVLEELPPGGLVKLADFLPDMRQLDFFKTLAQLGGLSVHTDLYEDYIFLSPSATICDNVSRALNWTSKRDTPDAPTGQPGKVTFQYGSYAQKNHFRYLEDEDVTKGYGDGVLLIDDTNLPLQNEMLTLKFAATERSKTTPGLLRIAAYKIRENEDAFAEVQYDKVVSKPRLTLATERTIRVVLSETVQINGQDQTSTRTVEVPVSHFSNFDEVESLDAQAYILPRNWRGLLAMLTECRFYTERYRLDQRMLQQFLENRNVPIWDATLKAYFSVSRIVQYSSLRSVEVEMLRLHPSLLVAPTGIVLRGAEFFEEEFMVNEPGQPGEFF